MTRRTLSATQVTALKAEGTHWLDRNLYLQIKPRGARSYLYRYERDGKTSWVGLGAASRVSLSKAREEADRMRVRMGDGIDPLAEREATKPKAKQPSFAECADRYIKDHRDGWKSDKHAEQWPSTIRMYVNPIMGKKAVDQITVEDVLRVLKPIWSSKPETATRVRGRIEKILGWAEAMGFRSGTNPAQLRGGALEHLLPPIGKVQKIEHHKAVPYAEVPKLMQELRQNDSTSAKALIFTILTAARTGEVRDASWDEIDLEQKVWTIPAERMKAAREHRVALSGAATDLLRAMPRTGRFIFPGPYSGRGLSNMAMLQLLRGLRDDGVTVHGFRSSFRDWAAEQTDVPREVVEACLAHAVGDGAELAYKRTDFLEKRRALMEAWAALCRQVDAASMSR
ncbi:MAG: integrase arm-type DNA-binding domain-containing protein [Devosia sp.]|nr:integrase arm-type DNA-binding domain-containing protein [Devosia sp.]